MRGMHGWPGCMSEGKSNAVRCASRQLCAWIDCLLLYDWNSLILVHSHDLDLVA